MPEYRVRILDRLLRDVYLYVNAEDYEQARKQMQNILHDAGGNLTELERLLGVSLLECAHTITIDSTVLLP